MAYSRSYMTTRIPREKKKKKPSPLGGRKKKGRALYTLKSATQHLQKEGTLGNNPWKGGKEGKKKWGGENRVLSFSPHQPIWGEGGGAGGGQTRGRKREGEGGGKGGGFSLSPLICWLEKVRGGKGKASCRQLGGKGGGGRKGIMHFCN